ncbi:hypothetical protein [Xanthomonas phage X1]|nr:hypothetical protein [Xanthomonas phage X1]
MSMNTIPTELIAVPNYDGYFWHPGEEQLYSLKVTGTLKPMKYHGARYVPKLYRQIPASYSVSRAGKKSILTKETLRKITQQKYEVPYESRSRI